MSTSVGRGFGVAFVAQLDDAFANGQVVCLADGAEPSVRPLGLWSRMWHWRDSEFHEKRLDALAGTVAKVLSVRDRMELREVLNDKAVQVGTLLKSQIKQYKVGELAGAQQLTKELTAIRLGICAKTLDANPRFQAFAEKYHLSQYLIHHDGRVKVAPHTLEISLKRTHEYVRWSGLEEEIAAWPKRETKPQEPWIYGDQGIQDRDMYDWTVLKPYKKEDPSAWGKKYVYERCVCRYPGSKIRWVHAWPRLKTPEGYIYSAGLYAGSKRRSESMSFWDYFTLLETQPGHLMSPDVSESWPIEIRRSSHVITKEDFEMIKAEIEKDRAIDLDSEKGLVFQQYNNSCSLWCKKLEMLVGIHIENGESTPQALMPTHVYRRIESVHSAMPTVVQRICAVVSTFFWNSVQWIFGANTCHPSLNDHQRSCARRPFQTVADLFREENNILNNPGSLFERLQAY